MYEVNIKTHTCRQCHLSRSSIGKYTACLNRLSNTTKLCTLCVFDGWSMHTDGAQKLAQKFVSPVMKSKEEVILSSHKHNP